MKHSRRNSSHRRFRRRWPWALAIVLLVAAAALDRSGLLMVRQIDDLAHYQGAQVQVTRVVSPHTIEVQLADEIERRPFTQVRLWGVTAPLPAGPGREAQPLSDEAMQFTRDLVEGRAVILHLESHRTRDTFNRLLAHVQLSTGATLNESLLDAGLARVDERWPHARLTRYAQAQQDARRRRAGVWASD